MTRDPFNAGISLGLLVSTKKILGTRAGTFATRGSDCTPMPLIYIDLLEIYGGETGIRTLEGCYTLLVFKTSAFNRSAIPPKDWYDTVFMNKVNEIYLKKLQFFAYNSPFLEI